MKIYKVGAVTQGTVILRTIIDLETGKVREEWVREGKSKCNKKDEAFLGKLSTEDIPGYGPMTEVEDEGHTSEYWEQQNPIPTALPTISNTPPPGGKPKPKIKQQEEEERQKEGFGL